MKMLHVILIPTSFWCHSITSNFGKLPGTFPIQHLVNIFCLWMPMDHVAHHTFSSVGMAVYISSALGLEKTLSQQQRWVTARKVVAAVDRQLWMKMLFPQVQCPLLWEESSFHKQSQKSANDADVNKSWLRWISDVIELHFRVGLVVENTFAKFSQLYVSHDSVFILNLSI